MDSPTPSPRPSAQRTFQVHASRHFADWLAQHRISLAFTTYQAGKLLLLGRSAIDRISVFERSFDRAMGLWTDGQRLWLASAFQLWNFHNVLAEGETSDGYDRLYVPRVGYTTGDIDIHDVAVDGAGRVVFVSTLFSCLGTSSDVHNFTPLWRPPFISKLAAEDRCHLNGLAMHQGRPRFVTACSQSDVFNGWRDQRTTGGCVIDVASGEIAATGLAMPHSPRWHRDQLWLLNSGTGDFGKVDLQQGRFEPIAFCPGYARGLAFHGDYAIAGVSRPRDAALTGLPLDRNLAARSATPRTGLVVFDLATGDAVHWVSIEGIVEELYDVVVLPDTARPKALGLKNDEIRHNVWVMEGGKRSHWCAVKK